jgi:hypothetical protein
MTALTYKPLNVSKLDEKAREVLAQAFADKPMPPTENAVVEAIDEGFFVRLGDLIDSRGKEYFEQRPIILNGVLKILAGITSTGAKASGQHYPLSETGQLLRPIVVGYNDQGELIGIIGGRHRLVALLTAYQLSGVDIESEEFRSELIRVIPEKYDIRLVKCDNTSRSMTATENGSIQIQIDYPDVDLEDPDSIIDAYFDKEKNVTINKALSFATLALYQDDEIASRLPQSLTDLTISKIVSGVVTQFKKEYKNVYGKFPKYRELVQIFLAQIVKHLPTAVERFLAENASGNTAREYARIVQYLLPLVADFDMTKFQQAADLGAATPTRGKIAKAAQDKIAAADGKKTRKPRAKKIDVPTESPEPVEAV